MSTRDLVMAAAGMSAGMSAGGLNVSQVFSTSLYTGNGGIQTINNGIDLANNGGMVWTKDRTNAFNHGVFDTARGSSGALCTNLTNGNLGNALSSFNANGFTINASTFNANVNAANMASWTFRKAPKFFDVVSWAGDGAGIRTIAHNLAVAPGCIIVKPVNGSSNWHTYHRSIPTGYLKLNLTDANQEGLGFFPNVSATSFGTAINTNGITYVAYLFAHDPEPTGVIQCGSFTADASGNAAVTLGWEPQYLLIKQTNAVDNWLVLDAARGLSSISSGTILLPNSTSAELGAGSFIKTTATGVNVSVLGAGNHYIYMAIRKPS